MANYTLTINVYYTTGGNSVTPPSGGVYPGGTVVDLTASPGSGYVFAYWTGAVADPLNPSTTITMSTNRTISAYFGQETSLDAVDVPEVGYTTHTDSQLKPGTVVAVPEVSYTNTFEQTDLTNIGGAILHDNTGDTDYTTEANEDTTDDVQLLPNSTGGGDGFYFLGSEINAGMKMSDFILLVVNVTTAGAGSWTLTWYYWNGSDWAELSTNLKSNPLNFRTAGYNIVVITPPSDWEMVTILSRTGYGIFAKVTAYSSKTTTPLAGRIRFIPFTSEQGNWMGILV